jgi:hypothetical protein
MHKLIVAIIRHGTEEKADKLYLFRSQRFLR